MTPIIKQLVLGGYTSRVPQKVLGEYLDKYYRSMGSWNIIEALDMWVKEHRKSGGKK